MSELNNMPNINNRDLIKTELKNTSLDNFEQKLRELARSDYQKTEVLWAANELAKENELEKALRVVEFLYTDENPKADDEYNQMILQEKDARIITTVRGVACWVLQSILITLKTEYYPRAINIVAALLKDKNLYVRQHATIPLEVLMMNIRATKNRDGSDFDFKEGDKKRTEELAFDFLEENKRFNRVLEYATSVFGHVRYLKEEEAGRVLNTFFFDDEGKMRPNYVVEAISPLAIYYAEYRETAYKDGFNSQSLKDFLKKVITQANDRVKSHLLWIFWKNYRKEDTDNIRVYLPLLFTTEKYSDEIRAQWDFLVEKVSEDNPELAFELLQEGLNYTITALKGGEDIRKSWLNIDKSLKNIYNYKPELVNVIRKKLQFLKANQISLGDLSFIKE